jgi:uncharacterized protein
VMQQRAAQERATQERATQERATQERATQERTSGAQETGAHSLTVAVRVHPGASREAVALLPDGSLDVRLRARAVEGQANARLVELLAERLGVRRREVEIASGLRSRQKVIRLALASHDELRQRVTSGSAESRG